MRIRAARYAGFAVSVVTAPETQICNGCGEQFLYGCTFDRFRIALPLPQYAYYSGMRADLL